MSQLMRALVFLHRLRIAHRDLKLENFLLAERHTEMGAARVVIADFGCATEVDPDSPHGLSSLSLARAPSPSPSPSLPLPPPPSPSLPPSRPPARPPARPLSG